MTERLPSWFKKRIPSPTVMAKMNELMTNLHLNTICQSAICPNIGDCFSRHTATFLIMGDTCTRNCTFCAVNKGKPGLFDDDEPLHIVEAVNKLKLSHVVITSVTRDDLLDGGAGHFARLIGILKKEAQSVTIEVLVPDFGGSITSLETVMKAHPHVLNHNVETVPRLYPEVRPMANFVRSVELLRLAKTFDSSVITKSGLMVGLGETIDEIIDVMSSLRGAGCDILTIGQYLRPSIKHHPVINFITPEQFEELAQLGKKMGFRGVAAAPLVRSSFQAAELYRITSANSD
jgi:lipoic acid synthetase